VVLRAPEVTLTDLAAVCRGAVWNFQRNLLECPWEVWTAVRELPEEWELVEHIDVTSRLSVDLEEDRKSVLLAHCRCNEFDEVLRAQRLSLRPYQRAGVEWLTRHRV